jgi:NAD(P)H-hydrate epimerase
MYLSRDEVRNLDRRAIEEYGVPGVVLMENAGRGCAELLRSLGVHGPVVVCCGKGNNGGDGFVVARHLDNAQIPVKVLLFGRPEDLAGDAAINYRILTRTGLPIETLQDKGREKGDFPFEEGRTVPFFPVDGEKLRQEFAPAEWIVDGLFGTGLAGPVRPPFDQVIAAINARSARVLAIDIPSGLDCDTGQPLGPTVRAEHTATFVGLKKGFANPAAQPWLGRVHVIDIGLPRRLLENLPQPPRVGLPS